jgi:hypothetical protein
MGSGWSGAEVGEGGRGKFERGWLARLAAGPVLIGQIGEGAIQQTRYMILETIASISDNPIVVLSAGEG